MYNRNHITVKTFIKSMLIFSISSWINFFFSILAVLILTRIFSPEIYGVLNLFNTATMVLVTLSCLGLDSGFFRFYYEPPKGWTPQQLFAKSLFISLGVLLLISIIALSLFYKEISMKLFNKISFFLTVLLCVNACSYLVLNNFVSQFHRISNNKSKYNTQQVLVGFFSKLFVISSAFINPEIDTVIFMNVIGLFILTIVYCYTQFRDIMPADMKFPNHGFGTVAWFSIFNFPTSLVLMLNAFLIPFFISVKIGTYWVGIYASAGFFVSAFSVLQSGFRTYWSAFMYEHYKDEQEKIIRIHGCIFLFIMLILSLFILAQHAVYLMIGEQFHSSRLFFSLVLIEPLLSLFDQTTCYGNSLTNRNYINAAIFVITILINLSLVWFMLPQFGVVGVAFSSCVSTLIRSTFLLIYGQKYYKSVSNNIQSILGMLLIVMLAVSNYVFYQDYMIELLVVIFFLVIACGLYKEIFAMACGFFYKKLNKNQI